MRAERAYVRLDLIFSVLSFVCSPVEPLRRSVFSHFFPGLVLSMFLCLPDEIIRVHNPLHPAKVIQSLSRRSWNTMSSEGTCYSVVFTLWHKTWALGFRFWLPDGFCLLFAFLLRYSLMRATRTLHDCFGGTQSFARVSSTFDQHSTSQ